MEEPAFSAVDFPLGFCAACGKDVLIHVDYLDDGGERLLCVECDAPLHGPLREVSGAELQEHGYHEVRASGCASGGCGSGRCARGG